MAVRREKVILELEDDFTAGIARAAAANKIFGDSLGQQSRSLRSYTQESQRAESQTNRLGAAMTGLKTKSQGAGGMLGVVVAGVATLGGPLSAAAVGGIAGISNELGVAAAGAGVFMLAMHGVGTAFQALDNYAQNPSKSTLKAAQNALQDLPVSAQRFVKQLELMKPALDRLREGAASGLFPGLTDALVTIEKRGPQIQAIIHALAQAEGELASQGAHALAGPGWNAFFTMWQRDGKSMMLDLGHALGNVTQALANLWVAFEPLNKDFSRGMVEMTADFDKWTAGLSKTQGFQEFLAYIHTNGPLLLSTIGKIAKLFIDVVTATAPLGGPVLTAIGSIADALDQIAKTDIAKPFILAAAAAYTLNTLTQGRLLNGIKGLAKGGGKSAASAVAGDLIGSTKPVPVYVVNEGFGGMPGGGSPTGAATKGGVVGGIQKATDWFGKHPVVAAVGQATLIASAAVVAEEVTRKILIPQTKQSLQNYQAGLGLGMYGSGSNKPVDYAGIDRSTLGTLLSGIWGNKPGYVPASTVKQYGGSYGNKAISIPGFESYNNAMGTFTVNSKKAADQLHALGVEMKYITVQAKQPVLVTADTSAAVGKMHQLRADAAQPVTVPITATLVNVISAIQGSLKSIFNFDTGGFTGMGGKYEPAGVVHKGEYVFSSEATKAAGPSNLDRMHKALRGYWGGGLVAGLPGYASGGLAASSSSSGMWLRAHPDAQLTREFNTFSAALTKATNSVNAQTAALNTWKSKQSTLSQGTLGMFTGNPWQNTNAWMGGGGAGSVFSQLTLDTSNAKSFSSLGNSLMKRGLHGDALAAAESQGLDAMRSLSQLSSADLKRYQSLFDARTRAAQGAASVSARSYSGEIATSQRILTASLAQQKLMNARLLKVEDAIKPLAAQFAHAINKSAAAGHKKSAPLPSWQSLIP